MHRRERARVESLLLEHGLHFLIGAGFLYGLSVPTPLAVLLMAGGGMAQSGEFPWWALVLGCPLAMLLGEQVWFFLGRKIGPRLLYRLPFVSTKRVDELRERFLVVGPRLILSGRFVPGLPACLVPLAGMTGVPWLRFFAWDFLSLLLYSTVYSGCGAVLSNWLNPGQITILALIVLALVHGLMHLRRRAD